MAGVYWTESKIIHAGNGREMHLQGVPNVKLTGIVKRQKKFLSISVVFGMGVIACPIDINP
jgi:hypothetical protein